MLTIYAGPSRQNTTLPGFAVFERSPLRPSNWCRWPSRLHIIIRACRAGVSQAKTQRSWAGGLAHEFFAAGIERHSESYRDFGLAAYSPPTADRRSVGRCMLLQSFSPYVSPIAQRILGPTERYCPRRSRFASLVTAGDCAALPFGNARLSVAARPGAGSLARRAHSGAKPGGAEAGTRRHRGRDPAISVHGVDACPPQWAFLARSLEVPRRPPRGASPLTQVSRHRLLGPHAPVDTRGCARPQIVSN